MINGKITDTMLAVTDTGLILQMAIGFKENGEMKNIITSPINLRNLSDINSFLMVVGVTTYEAVKNSAIQFEMIEGKLAKISNFCDSELKINFINEDELTAESSRENDDSDD